MINDITTTTTIITDNNYYFDKEKKRSKHSKINIVEDHFGKLISKQYKDKVQNYSIINDAILFKKDKIECLSYDDILDFKSKIENTTYTKDISSALWQVNEIINIFFIEHSKEHRVNELGEPYHPLEEELLDVMDGGKTTLSLNGEQVPIEYYANREKINGKNEKYNEFLNRVYADYIKADVLYSTYLSKIDRSLYRALSKDKKGISAFIPESIDYTNRLCNKAIEKRIQVETVANMVKNMLKKEAGMKK